MTQAARRLEFELPDWVYDILQDETKFRKHWITKGLGSGGTYGGAIWHYVLCQLNHRSRASWAVAPTFTQVIDPLIPTFTQVLTEVFELQEGVDFKVVSSQFPRIDLVRTRQQIFFKSAAHPERLVGANISHALGTELGLWKNASAFQKVMSRIRCPNAERLQFLGEGSPEGMNWWADEANFDPGVDEDRNATRTVLETDDNPYLPDGYIENNLELVYAHDRIKLQSYRRGLFVPFTKGTAYWNYVDRYPMVSLDMVPDKSLPILWCWDFNRAPLAWVVMQQGYQEKFGIRYPKFRVLHESSGTSKGLLEASAEFMARFPSREWGDHRIEIYGDASGYSGSHKAPLCDYSQIENYMREGHYARVAVRASRDNPDVRPRLERTNALFAYDMVQIAAHCHRLRSGLTTTALKEGTWNIEKPQKDTWTHYPEAMDYGLFQMTIGLDLNAPAMAKKFGVNAR